MDSLQDFATPKSPAVRKALDGIRAVTDEIAREVAAASVPGVAQLSFGNSSFVRSGNQGTECAGS